MQPGTRRCPLSRSASGRGYCWLRGNGLLSGRVAEAKTPLKAVERACADAPATARGAVQVPVGRAASVFTKRPGDDHDQLKLELSPAKALITHGRTQAARFLGNPR